MGRENRRNEDVILAATMNRIKDLMLTLQRVVLGCRRQRAAPLAIAAIFKDEGPYILEWLAHHRSIGVALFFIADNNSSDGSSALLAALDRAGVITHIPFPGTKGETPQLPAYERIMERFGDQADWVAFIDADEFLRPTTLGARPLAAWLAALPRSVGAVGVNWANYGSSGRVMPGSGLINERFSKRAADDNLTHSTFKSIVRSRDWCGTTNHPHRFAIPRNRRFVDTGLRQIQIRKGRPGKAMRICWDVLRIDHFVVKSQAEFIHKKRRRGRAGKSGAQHDLGFFAAHDQNDIFDPCPPERLEAIRVGIEELRTLLGDLPPEVRDLDRQLEHIPPPQDTSRASRTRDEAATTRGCVQPLAHY